MKVTVFDSYTSLDSAEWDALVGDGSPFLEHVFLAGLETTGCAVPETGWTPRPILVHDDTGKLVGGAPAWLTTHSRGEFVYDHAWADAARRNGLPYYPKTVVCVPFTPVTGSRLLVAPGADRTQVVPALLKGLEHAGGETHGVHVLFNSAEEAAELAAFGLFTRSQFQFHWRNRGYGSFDDFLADFPSKKRKNIKRERRHCAPFDIEAVEAPDAADMDALYRFYMHTCDQFSVWGARYLNLDFYHLLQEHWGDRLLAVMARQDGKPVAGTFNVRKGDRLYGRYWGADGEQPFLHFELCYYRTIEYAIAHGIQVFEPGHGGGHKFVRGFLPELTYSSHALAHPGLNDALRRHTFEEMGWVRKRALGLWDESPLKWAKDEKPPR